MEEKMLFPRSYKSHRQICNRAGVNNSQTRDKGSIYAIVTHSSGQGMEHYFYKC